MIKPSVKQVQPHEIVVGREYVVKQEFSHGHAVSQQTTTGTAVKYEDEHLWIGSELLPSLNLHPHVGMPNVYIYEIV